MRSTQHEGAVVDTDAILRITRAPKTPPTYVPRSRSMEDLPGGLRVPILQRPQSRVAARLEALQDGLQELNILREHQKELVDHVKVRHIVEKKQEQGSHLSRRRYSTSALSSISEENTYVNFPVRHQSQLNNATNRENKTPNNSSRTTDNTSVMHSKRRRPSFQCDTIITKDFNQQIPYMASNGNQTFPSPMHAVMRHYEVVLKSANSESNLRKSTSQCELKSTPTQNSIRDSIENVSKTEGLQKYLKQRRSSLPVALKSVKVTDIDQFWQNYSNGIKINGNKYAKEDINSMSLDTTTESTLSSVEEETEQENQNTGPTEKDQKEQLETAL
ncbi:uncharacterized protein LOC133176735 [Saccostrea echinata]|uniref:uncharacterized protein LOC133176735 n=1 Tax=Saccostrea echinata TaxID=191078 RepID=UPI002A833D25|nr:uncharacterized protein LOC133176735 [Saccostrea echinata]